MLEAILIARHHVSAGELEAAEALLQEKNHADALHLLGVIQFRRGALEAAERLLRRAIERDAAVAAYHHDLGNVLQDRGRLAEAIAAYRRSLRLHPGFAESWNDLGTARAAKGELVAAAECYRQALRLRPDHLVAHANLGAACRKLGLLSEARRAFQHEFLLRLKNALWRKKPDPAREELERGHLTQALALAKLSKKSSSLRVAAEAHLRLGQIDEALKAARAARDPLLLERAQAEESLRRGDAAAAVGHLRRALARTPRSSAVHMRLGQALERAGERAEAERAYRRALELDPLSLTATVRLSDLLRGSGRLDEAEAAARAALEIDDEAAAAHLALGMALKARGMAKKPRECFERALELNPKSLQAMQQVAHALRDEDRLGEAEKLLRQALRERPDEPALLTDLGMVLADELDYDAALALFDRALARDPRFVLALNRKALVLDQLGERAKVRELLEEALRIAPGDDNARYNLGLHRLKYGEWAAGWNGYERRRSLDNFVGRYRRFALPEWDGGPLAGRTILVLPEQGLGDEIMFASCIPDLAREAGHVMVECDPKLEAIFQRSFPGCTVVSRQRTVANDWIHRVEPKPELQIPAGSLAGRYRKSASDFPQQAFLKPDPKNTENWKARLAALGPGRKIGLSWRGGVGVTGKKRRSFALAELAPVLRLPGVHWVSLQYTDVREELKASPVRVHHWPEAIDDYDQTAALVAALDGVLTVCTAIVHLAGGLGRPALVMVPLGAEWRYGGAGERMAWYSSVRLVRQKEAGRWAEVLEEVSRRIASNTFS